MGIALPSHSNRTPIAPLKTAKKEPLKEAAQICKKAKTNQDC